MRILSIIYGILLVAVGPVPGTAADLPRMVDLGRSLFNDPELSVNGDQACAFCHDPAAGFSGPLATVNAGGSVYEGSVEGRFGNRRPPTAAYVSPGPVFHHVMEDGGVLFVGGLPSNDLGETYETRRFATGSKSVTVTSDHDTVPTVEAVLAADFDYDAVSSGWVEIRGDSAASARAWRASARFSASCA